MSCFYTEVYFGVVNGGVYENISAGGNGIGEKGLV